MSEWCATQLKKINGSEDITLMQFCMSLESPVEIREYLAEYLGSSAQVVIVFDIFFLVIVINILYLLLL